MKREILSVLWIQIRILVIIGVLFFSSLSWAQCPQDPNDLGICDTLYVETFDGDHVYQATAGYDSVRVAIYVTHDSNTFWWEGGNKWVQDSIAVFCIPLTFWHQPAGHADSVILPTYNNWNNTSMNRSSYNFRRSIFRDLYDPVSGVTYYNRFADMVENGEQAWFVVRDIESHSCDTDSGHVWLNMLAVGRSGMQKWWEGSRVLLATLTFLVYMNEGNCATEIGFDSTFWPPSQRLYFARYGDLLEYVPRHFLPVIDTIALFPPQIISITDVGNDQGRQVRLNWERHCHDVPGSPVTITGYSIWRRIGDDKAHSPKKEILHSDLGMFDGGRLYYPPGEWDFIKTVPARGESTYNTVCPTLGDSTQADSMYWSVFFVSAMTTDPLVYFDYDPDSGYSLDNIPPLPCSLEINLNSWFTLYWTVPGEYVSEHPISTYDIRYNTVPVGADTQAWWNSATACTTGERFFNFIVGETDSLKVAKDCGCHPVVYFAIKGLDDRPNYSEISNIVGFQCGDATGDTVVDASDLVYLLNYLFVSGPPPNPLAAGDVNCDGIVDISDVVYLLNYLFVNGPPPCSS
jgi:hypothetical protein